jgi:hypothetical protein
MDKVQKPSDSDVSRLGSIDGANYCSRTWEPAYVTLCFFNRNEAMVTAVHRIHLCQFKNTLSSQIIRGLLGTLQNIVSVLNLSQNEIVGHDFRSGTVAIVLLSSEPGKLLTATVTYRQIHLHTNNADQYDAFTRCVGFFIRIYVHMYGLLIRIVIVCVRLRVPIKYPIWQFTSTLSILHEI